MINIILLNVKDSQLVLDPPRDLIQLVDLSDLINKHAPQSFNSFVQQRYSNCQKTQKSWGCLCPFKFLATTESQWIRPRNIKVTFGVVNKINFH